MQDYLAQFEIIIAHVPDVSELTILILFKKEI